MNSITGVQPSSLGEPDSSIAESTTSNPSPTEWWHETISPMVSISNNISEKGLELLIVLNLIFVETEVLNIELDVGLAVPIVLLQRIAEGERLSRLHLGVIRSQLEADGGI